jgi:Putative addiction module component
MYSSVETKMTLETMIGSLSRDEKLAAIDLIWRDLTADSQPFVSPEWHEKVIADRLDNSFSGPALPLAEAKAEIKEAIDARRASR